MAYIAGNPLLSVSRQVWEGAALGGQNAITIPGGCVPNMSDVFVGGACLSKGDFDDTDGLQIKLTKPMQSGTQYRVVTYAPGQSVVNATGQLAGFRNRIINGDCRVAQYASATLSSSLVSAYCGPDRWWAANGGAGGSFQQSQGTLGVGGVNVKAVAQTVQTVLTDLGTNKYWSGFRQVIEGYNCYDMLGQPCAISFLFYAAQAGDYSLSLEDGPQTYSYTTRFTVPAATVTPIRIILPSIPLAASIPNSNAPGLQLWVAAQNNGQYLCPVVNQNQWVNANYITAQNSLNWGLSASGQIIMTNAQLEAGSVVTRFENRPYGFELALSQRYYHVNTTLTGVANIQSGFGLTYYLPIYFPVTMRAVPAMTQNAGSVRNMTGQTITNITTSGATYMATAQTVGSVGADYCFANWNGYVASAEL
jgi:hypothetical protein